MDVEKTIQFLVENAAQHDQRLAALEANGLTLGSALITLTGVVKDLAHNVDDLRREMRAREAESRARDAALDERIGKLVSAIAALLNGRSSPPAPQH